MERKKFLEIYPEFLNKQEEYGIVKCVARNKFREIIKIDFIYNTMAYGGVGNSLQKQSINDDRVAGYVRNLQSLKTKNLTDKLIKEYKEDDVKLAIEQSQVMKELVARKYPVECTFEKHSVYDINGEVHHWDVYAILECDIECFSAFYKNAKNKTFIFTEDGAVKLKTPPELLKNEFFLQDSEGHISYAKETAPYALHFIK